MADLLVNLNVFIKDHLKISHTKVRTPSFSSLFLINLNGLFNAKSI